MDTAIAMRSSAVQQGTRRAYGDLDGDGVQSTFEIQGSLRRPYEVISGPVTFTSELE